MVGPRGGSLSYERGTSVGGKNSHHITPPERRSRGLDEGRCHQVGGEAHRRVYHSTLGVRVIQKKEKKRAWGLAVWIRVYALDLA